MNNSLQFTRENTNGITSDEEVDVAESILLEEIESWLNSETDSTQVEEKATLSFADERMLEKAKRSDRIDKNSKAHRYSRAKNISAKNAKKEAKSQLEYINDELDDIMDKKLDLENAIFAGLNGISQMSSKTFEDLLREFECIIKQEQTFMLAKRMLEHPKKQLSLKERSKKEERILSKHYTNVPVEES